MLLLDSGGMTHCPRAHISVAALLQCLIHAHTAIQVTESEDVSYVSSPHLPFYVRARGSSKKKLSSNRGRAREATLGITNIDAEMTEYVKLDDVTVCSRIGIP